MHKILNNILSFLEGNDNDEILMAKTYFTKANYYFLSSSYKIAIKFYKLSELKHNNPFNYFMMSLC